MERDVTLRIVLEQPPAGVDFGLQKGRGSAYETILKRRSQGKHLEFEFAVGVKAGGKDAVPVFAGPLIQGPTGQRFIYIDIGAYAGQADTAWSRRLKIPLGGITWEMINSQAVLEARVRGTGKDGGPSCGTAKPFAGWKLQRK